MNSIIDDISDEIVADSALEVPTNATIATLSPEEKLAKQLKLSDPSLSLPKELREQIYQDF
jgi:hypothetical protein